MKTILLLSALFITCCVFTYSQDKDCILWLGVTTNETQSYNDSYGWLYNHADSAMLAKLSHKPYKPLQTIGIVRQGNEVKIYTLPYLFYNYMCYTLSVRERENDTSYADEDAYYYASLYSLSESVTKVLIAHEEVIKQVISDTTITFNEALHMEYENISFITPDFYITEGYESDVFGGAAWFTAQEFSRFQSNDTYLKATGNYLINYLSEREYIDIIKKACLEVYDEDFKENPISDSSWVPWTDLSKRLRDIRDVKFSYEYVKGKFTAYALVPLNGNWYRHFLYKVPLEIIPQKMIDDFRLQNKIQPELPFYYRIQATQITLYRLIRTRCLFFIKIT